MRDLPHCPAALAVGRVQLLFTQPFHRRAQLRGSLGNGRNGLLPQRRRNFLRRRVLAYGITRVHILLFLRPSRPPFPNTAPPILRHTAPPPTPSLPFRYSNS